MGSLDIEAGGSNTVVSAGAVSAADMEEATRDVAKLRRVLVGGGVGQAAAALYMLLCRAPAGLLLRSGSLVHAYYWMLAAIVAFGVAQAWTGLWVSHDPPRRAVGVAVLWASLLGLVLLAGVGGVAIVK